MNLPQARLENIVVQDLSWELLVYNLMTHKAYTLNETSKIVFNACDGKTTFADLKRRHKFTDDLIYLALDELSANDLLAGYQSNRFAGISRRNVIKRVGLASMAALPMISSIIAPKAVHAASNVAVNYCEEVECPYAENFCQYDFVCCDNAAGCGPKIGPGDCYAATFKPAGTPCNDNDMNTTGDVCDGSGNCVGTVAP